MSDVPQLFVLSSLDIVVVICESKRPRFSKFTRERLIVYIHCKIIYLSVSLALSSKKRKETSPSMLQRVHCA